MTPSILLITGGEDQARDTFREEGRVDWAQATPLLLEKLGYLGFHTAPPAFLADPATWQRHAVVLVPRLPPSAWTDRAVELALGGSAQLLVELPPPRLGQRLGVITAEPAPRFGAVAPLAPELRVAVEAASTYSIARLDQPQSRPVDRDPEMAWSRLVQEIDERQAQAWRQPGWAVERWAVEDGTEVLSEWVDAADATRSPAIVRSASGVVACAFSLLGFLAQQTTIQPFAGAEHISCGRSSSLEATLVFLLDQMHQRAGASRPRVLPWPEGIDWVLNIRHDFDRPRSRAQVDRVLSGHRELGTSATWYWRSRHVAKPAMATIARRVAATPGHEVALHTERLWLAAEEELKDVEAAVRRPVKGSSAHGDPSCFRWQGAPNVIWADRHGLDYTEFISHAHLHPHRFAALAADGTVGFSRVICLPHHESFDRSMEAGDVAAEGVLAAAEGYVRAGGMMQVLNHPDIHTEELFATLAKLPLAGRLDWTAAEAADWWRRTHVAGELRLEQGDDGTVTVTSERGVRGLVVELLAPDGERRRFALHLEAGKSVAIGAGAAPPKAQGGAGGWTQSIAPAFAEAARAYYVEQGIDAVTDVARSTIATNSDLVPGRVEAMRSYLAELGGITSLQGMRVLDCGAGFGAFAAYLSQGEDAPLVTAVDTRKDFAELANRIAAEEELQGFSYRVADMRTLEGLDDSSFDLVVVNNAFIYLTSKEEMSAAVRALARVTATGGYVFLFHANRWQSRDPFSRAPLVHLLPRSLANAVSRVTGWRHNHGRVRLVSAPAMSRMLRRNGFERIETGTIRGSRVVRPPRSHLARFYAVVARRAA